MTRLRCVSPGPGVELQSPPARSGAWGAFARADAEAGERAADVDHRQPDGEAGQGRLREAAKTTIRGTEATVETGATETRAWRRPATRSIPIAHRRAPAAVRASAAGGGARKAWNQGGPGERMAPAMEARTPAYRRTGDRRGPSRGSGGEPGRLPSGRRRCRLPSPRTGATTPERSSPIGRGRSGGGWHRSPTFARPSPPGSAASVAAPSSPAGFVGERGMGPCSGTGRGRAGRSREGAAAVGSGPRFEFEGA